MKDYKLVEYINHLINENNIVEFYHSSYWQNTRRYVLEYDHYECQDCAKKGILSKAVLVHHVNEVKSRPDLALSLYYVNSNGKQERNLVSLCFNCHEKRHNRAFTNKQNPKKFFNKEWW